MDKLTLSMGYGTLGLILGLLVGMYIIQITVENLTNYRTGDLMVLLEVCQEKLPRDKFCKLEIKAVEDN